MGKETRMYGLFVRDSEGWKRVRVHEAYLKSEAVRRFQSVLLNGAIGAGLPAELRIIDGTSGSGDPRRRRGAMSTGLPCKRGAGLPAELRIVDDKGDDDEK